MLQEKQSIKSGVNPQEGGLGSSAPGRPHIVILESTNGHRDQLTHTLIREGFGVSAVSDCEQLADHLRSRHAAMIIFDWEPDGGPDTGDGCTQVCDYLKNKLPVTDVPLLVLGCSDSEDCMVQCLEVRADDYVVKPYSPRVVAARAKAILRWKSRAGANERPDPVQRIGDLVIHRTESEVRAKGKRIELTSGQFQLLTLLADEPGKVYSRQVIVEKLHGSGSDISERSVDAQVVMLRRNLGAYGDIVQTIRAVGYRLDV